MELDFEDKASRDSFYGSSAARPAMLFDKHSKAVSRSERENAVNGLLGGTPGMLLLLLPLSVSPAGLDLDLHVHST